MRLKGKAKARCKRYDKKETGAKKKDALTADVYLEIVSTPKQAVKLYGETFGAMCFSDTITEEGATYHLVSCKTPSPDFKPEKHAIDMDGTEVIAKPVLGKVYPVENAEKVRVTMRLSVYVGGDDTGVGAALEALAGRDVELAFSETNLELPFGEGSNGGGEEE